MPSRASQVRTLKLKDVTLEDLRSYAARTQTTSAVPTDLWLFENQGTWTFHSTEDDASFLWHLADTAHRAGHHALAITGESFHQPAPYYAFTDFSPHTPPKTWWVDPLRGLNDDAPIRALLKDWLHSDDLPAFLSEELNAWPGTYVGRLRLGPELTWDITNRPSKLRDAFEKPLPAPVSNGVKAVTNFFAWAWVVPMPFGAGFLLYGLARPSAFWELWPASLTAALFVSWLAVVPLDLRGRRVPWPLRLLGLVTAAALTPYLAWWLR